MCDDRKCRLYQLRGESWQERGAGDVQFRRITMPSGASGVASTTIAAPTSISASIHSASLSSPPPNGSNTSNSNTNNNISGNNNGNDVDHVTRYQLLMIDTKTNNTIMKHSVHPLIELAINGSARSWSWTVTDIAYGSPEVVTFAIRFKSDDCIVFMHIIYVLHAARCCHHIAITAATAAMAPFTNL